MKYIEVSYLNVKDREKLEGKGLYCYDLRYSDLGKEIACIEKYVLVNRVGSIVTNEKIQLGDKFYNNHKDYKEFIKENENVNSIEDLLSAKMTKSFIDRKIRKDAEKFLENQTQIKKYIYAFTEIDKLDARYNSATFIEEDTNVSFAVYPELLKLEFPPKWLGNSLENLVILSFSQSDREIVDISKYAYKYMDKVLKNMDKKNIENNVGIKRYLDFCKRHNIKIKNTKEKKGETR